MQSATAEKRELIYSQEEDSAESAKEVLEKPEQNSSAVVYPPARPEEVRCIELETEEPKNAGGYALLGYRQLAMPKQVRALVPTIFADIFHYLPVYIMLAAVCVLAMYKVHQVQDTRSLTAQFNEINVNNDNLQKEWLSLLAERQSLSSHSQIREVAAKNLGMVKPKTEDEIMIRLSASR